MVNIGRKDFEFEKNYNEKNYNKVIFGFNDIWWYIYYLEIFVTKKCK